MEFHIESNSTFIKWNTDNVISVRVYDGGGAGGLFGSIPYLNAMELIDGIKIATTPLTNKKPTVNFSNSFATTIDGKYVIACINEEDGSTISKTENDISLAKGQNKTFDVPLTKEYTHISYMYSFVEATTKKSISESQYLPYILTPKPGDAPKINGAKIFGVRPNSPFVFKIPATGKKPLQYSVENLPEGFTVNPKQWRNNRNAKPKWNIQSNFCCKK
ncbi:MAG: hypothetical protein WDM90_19950 [Ferruginibacter sp.]